MAARQIWLFLTEVDVRALFDRLEQRDPGLVVSAGRYFRGDSSALLSQPSKLERREVLPGEVRHYLLHRKHSEQIVGHLQPAGPFAGWSQIDEERTDCLVLRVPTARDAQLGSSRLYAHTSFWRGPAKIRKRPVFALWANQTLRWLLGQYPSTAVDFIRIGPDALTQANAGALRLAYLQREIGAVPAEERISLREPEGTLSNTAATEPEESTD